MLPDPEYFGIFYHEAYKVSPSQLKKKIDWSKLKKKLTKFRNKSRNKIDVLYGNDTNVPPEIELPGNASAFAVFASIRLAVLDRWMHHASEEYLHSSCSAPIQDLAEIESDTEDNSQSCSHHSVKISKVVSLGLRSVFELIRESRMTHPTLCTKALLALLNVIQGQSPEGLKSEPSEVIDPLFDLLLDLATLHGPESSVPNDGTHLTALACACLLSLVVVRGDTGKFLSASAALLMCPRALALQNIKMSSVLCSLQRSVYGVLLEKNIRPDWITHGVPDNSAIDSFYFKLPNELNGAHIIVKSLACDGHYFYLFSSKGLFKIGSGFGGTIKGDIILWKPDFYPNDNGVLVHCGGNLYLKLSGRHNGEILTVDKTSLLITGSVLLHNKDASSSIIFSDGDFLGIISLAKDDSFVVRTLNHNTSPASVINELPLKLVKKCIEVFGAAPFEEEIGNCSFNVGNEEEVVTIAFGKEFGLLRTFTGKVLYCGKCSALGMKQSGVRTGKWSDLNLTKSPKINHIAVGHDGLHAILIAEDGSAFFTGTARRGEDGDQNKVRRQVKPVKPKKMIKVDGHHIVGGACNHGTTALINSNGELIMFGKDAAHTDPATGIVTSLKGTVVVQVALGKAHGIALTNKGHIYTFGINNKYQCGRDFLFSKDENASHVTAMETCGVQEEYDLCNETNIQSEDSLCEPDENLTESIQNICPPGMHSWHDDMCMICSVCQECTGYSVNCLSSVSSERYPGQECGCGEGDSGCAICGCCRICAHEVVDNSDLADLAEIMKYELLSNDKASLPQKCEVREQIQCRLETKKNKSVESIQGFSKQLIKSKFPRPINNAASTTIKTDSIKQTSSLDIAKDQSGSDVEKDASRITCLPPAKIYLPSDSPVIQIACGLHHSIVLLRNGQVYTFGSNLYGQLGCGDILSKSSVQFVKLPCNAVQIAAGSNHSVVLTSKGEVYTFGNAQKGQLGRISSDFPQDTVQPEQSSTSRYNNPRTPWYSFPGPIPNVGSKHGRKATWIGASGDQTFLKLDENLINSISITKSTIIANKNSIILLPKDDEISRNFKCIAINKKDGICNYFKNQHQVDFTNKIICMDHIYNVLWSYEPSTNEMICYNIIATELQTDFLKGVDSKFIYDVKSLNKPKCSLQRFELPSILSPELALPAITECYVTRFQAAINLLCCLDILTTAYELHLPINKEDIEDNQFMPYKQYCKEDFQIINRFENHGGGWGYSGHSIEAIRFMTDTDVLLGGFGLFGGRGEYTAKLKLIDIGPDGGEQEIDGELVAETEDIQYECGPRQKFPILFEEPVHLQAQRWYVAWCRISGPSSDCGSSGQTMVITEEQVIFYFKSSKKSNNGTDVNAGQIPQLLYKIISHENQSPPKHVDATESTHILSKDFSRKVSKECFQSLLSLLQWSWNTFKWGVEGKAAKNVYNNLELERLVYISKASLRLICTYINEIYPRRINKRIPIENISLAECVGDTRTLLKQILSDNIPMANQTESTKTNESKHSYVLMLNSILDECHNTFVSCFHAFYPIAYLKWNCLCDLLGEINEPSNSQRLLSAVLCALCAPYVRLRNIFPLMGSINFENSFHRVLSSSDNTGLPIMSRSDSHHYPVLVEQMTYKTQVESKSTVNYEWNDVLDCLISLAANPVLAKLTKCDATTSSELIKHCCHLLARVVAELVLLCSRTEEEFQSYGRTLYITPSRFTRMNQSRTWNTGNGSPDAICFQVDREGISIIGAGVYGGIGHYEYELELLEDNSSSDGDNQVQAHRWNSLEITRGSYGPENFAPDIIEIKFERTIPIKENVKYAMRLRNHGGRTNNGDGGLACVRGPDNTNFTFSTCSLSFNGTTLTRGQLPVLLYYSNPLDCGRYSTTKSEDQARKAALSVASRIINKANNLMVLAREQAEEIYSANILSTSDFVTCLLPLVLAHISPLATSDSNSTVQILNLIKEILPHVAALNLMEMPNINKCSMSLNSSSMSDVLDDKNNTTSRHYTLVESDHPYKASTVTNYRVIFPESVKWMSLEFDPACSTIQPEDSLQLYVPAVDYILQKKNRNHYLEATDNPPLPYWPVLHKFSGSLQWPSNSIILPGNEVVFSLETASDYLKDERFSAYGFKCLVVGYDWPLDRSLGTGLKRLEAELSFLGGMCTASLIKKDLVLPVIADEGDVDMEVADVIASEIFAQHGSLLAKGLALSSPPTVQQALDGVLPYNIHSNEKLFLRDFVNCKAGSSGGRLAQWLQPGSRVDPSKCRVLYSQEELHCGWPAIITVIIKDQYSDMVHVSNMRVELKAVPIDKRELGHNVVGCKIRKVSQPDHLSFGGLPPPSLHHLYEPTIKDKMCFHSITVMKPYQNYSFEELRYTSPPVKKSVENMLVRSNCDGTFSATWTPASVGYYSITVNIDGYEMEEVFKVEVKEPPQGMTPPNQDTAKKPSHKPNRLRKFVAKYSAGLRIRAHPSLQSEQIGVVHVNGTISFIDEIHNDDGVWLRLSADTIKQYCTVSVIEAWCLQYNQHLGKTLLLPVEESKTMLDKILTDTIMRKLPEIQERPKSSNCIINYEVIKCGASGHNIRSRPSLKAPPIGMLILGNKVGVTDYTINSDGCWVLLDERTKEKYCFNEEGDAWSLAIGQNNILYLGSTNDSDSYPKVTMDNTNSQKKRFNFSSMLKSGENNFSFSTQTVIHTVPSKNSNKISSNPFIFGENILDSSKISNMDEVDITANSLPKMFKGDVKSNEASLLPIISNNESTKDASECNANGNRITASDAAISFQSPKSIIRSSSPIGILVSGMSPERRGSNQSDTSAIPGNITKVMSQSSSEITHPRKMSPISSGSPLHIQSESNSAPTLKKDNIESEQIQHKQTGTQTSPDNTNKVPTTAHFSIGVTGKEEKVSPKLTRKDRTISKVKSKRAISPAQLQQLPTNIKMIYAETESIKQAMSPSLAEALRAVFAAFLWHEGIVHDAMACASFLKFHPTLPKHGVPVITRNSEITLNRRHKGFTKEEKARQRHSVEVTNAGNYLHIQPSTLESLTRSAANANANRNRKKVTNIKQGEKFSEKYQNVSVLPPALKSLVHLWEEVTCNCLMAVSQQKASTSSIHTKNNKSNKSEVNGRSESKEVDDGLEKGIKKCKKKKLPSRNYLEDIGLFNYLHSSGADTLCELCGDIFPRPVTYHMHQAHPGCGQHAGGKGFNSGGNYCLGWAGNCGDGGVPGSSWYLLCESCRQKYVKTSMGKNQINIHNKCTVRKKKYSSKIESPSLVTLEPHIIMRNNAMFLLDVASSAESNVRPARRSSVTIMPSVSEHNSPPELSGPFGPLPPFQCLSALDGNLCNNEDSFFSDLLNKHNIHEASGPACQRPLSEVATSENDLDENKGLRFHRSVSMGTNGIPWSKCGYESKITTIKKRNNSNCVITTNESGSSLLCNPSIALQKLITQKSEDTSFINSGSSSNESMNNFKLLQRPVLHFILQHHDLDSLQFSMRRALRKAMCRVYAMQALNWLLRSVTQPVCLHDLLWWFVTSLTPVEIDTESEEDNRPLKKEDEQDMTVCEHPLSDINIAGEAVHPLPNTFHSLLQTIADLMVLLPMGSALQQMAVRCWGIRFTSTDHSFLHRSQVFSNISKILSRSEEIEALAMHESYQKILHKETPYVECLKDLTPMAEIKASSRQAMVGSLTDNSTETFWESGDEDRNKTKVITIICIHGHHPTLVCVHIDSCRDIGNKVSSITFSSGQNTDELIKLRTMEVESRLLGGWVNCPIADSYNNIIRLELRGPDNSIRVRQIRVLGNIDGESLQVGKQYNYLTLQQKNCEAETLRVFRLITSQVFGKLLLGEEGQNLNNSGAQNVSLHDNTESLQESNDLREHMVGILFSRSKLTHLQKQVIVHIVQAIRKETERVYEEWESNLCTPTFATDKIITNSDTYCFEMLSMVLALSGSSVGRVYLSHQYGLLKDLVTLLHTGSARVQRQVTSLLRRMMSEISPETFAKIVGVKSLPAKDFSIITVGNKNVNSEKLDIDQLGILDIFLSIIAKALRLQVKIRGKNGNIGISKEINTISLSTSINSKQNLNEKWWLKGTVNKSLADIIINLIKDMASGNMSEIWAKITKGAIAENILSLTYLNDEQKLPNNCVQTATLWLALASLCVLDKDHVERLSSGQWTQSDGQPVPPRPTCDNHDDSETIAIIQCNFCGNLCGECDRYLHLHRKVRNHQRQVCKEEEEAIKVELHEGCGRTKLFWLLALADSRTLKALIEFREGGTKKSGVGISGICRFCGATENSGLLAIGNICADHECQEYGKIACNKLLNCGHICGGVLGESTCLPCLHGCFNYSSLKQDSDDMCMICFTEALSCAPAIQLKCGHVFHYHCCKEVLMKKWVGPRITFSFILCPICKTEIDHEMLEELLIPSRELYTDVRRKALMRLEYEGLHTAEITNIPGTSFHNDTASYAMDRYAYYMCYKCNKAYYGGEVRCDAELGENYDPTELVCGACSDVARAQMCPKHGTDFLEYKCRYCCSVAIFFCFGTTHFCNLCHDDFQRVTNINKGELPVCPAGPRAMQLEGDECPLFMKHPPTGEEFALGCGVCRNAHTF